MKHTEFKIVAEESRYPGAFVEKDGVSFGYYASGEDRPVLLLYKKGSSDVAAEIPFPKKPLTGNFYGMKVRFSPTEYEYNFQEGEQVITDPYAKKIAGREMFGAIPKGDPHSIRGGFLTKKYNWADEEAPQLAFEDVIMYHLHVRGFTMQKNSGVRKKGTFAGLREKIPYLKQLGVNQIKLMPINEFAEVELKKLPQHDEIRGKHKTSVYTSHKTVR